MLLGLLVVGAPLACGAVHRPLVVAALILAVGLALVSAVLGYRGRAKLRVGAALSVPLLFLLIAVLQTIPIPASLRARIDPAGSELLVLANQHGAQPLSLDPPSTKLEFAKAAVALAVGLSALVLSADRRFRLVAVSMVACAGAAALAIGLGHRAIFEEKIYGLFSNSRGLPNGPFINSNHTAEFLELAAFAALAFSFSRSTRDGQRIWKAMAAVLAAGALSTLSRGSVLALGAGVLVWFLLAPKSDDGEPLHRTRFVTGLITLLVVAGIALGFGADGLLARFSQNGAGHDGRFELWWNAIKILPTHPAGIGLGAFSRVFPVYREFPSSVWFQFPENQPLGFLIEAGLPGTALMLGACLLVIWSFFKNARRDRVEASLVAGLVAVLAHNLTDFGLETLGVLLPFCAVAGSLLGRQTDTLDRSIRRPATTVVALGVAGASVAAVVLLLSPSARDFDAFLRVPVSPTSRAALHEASLAHPTDYLYALAEASMESPSANSAASRLRMLNRAILLCPTCPEARAETARTLWRLGRRPQALLEWRTLLGISPERFRYVFAELLKGGAKPAELASLVSERNRYDLSQRLLEQGMVDAAREILAGSSERDGVDFHLAEAQVALAANDLGAAQAACDAALSAAPRDQRVVFLASEMALRQNQRDKAIDILERGLQTHPRSLDLNRKLLGLLVEAGQWKAADRALAGLRMALNEAGRPMTEANLAAARLFERRGQFSRAVPEYQAALSQDPESPGVWLALGKAAEQSGRVAIAVDAYNATLQREPENREARTALSRIQQDKKLIEVFGGQIPQFGVNRPR